MDKRLPILLITLFMTLGRIFAQGGSFPDTLSVKTGTDSTSKITNETESDTTSNGSLDAPIYYWADKGGFSRVGNKIYLKGHAKIVYQNMTLEAEKVMIDQEKKFLFAEGVADSTDSLGNPAPGFPLYGLSPTHVITLGTFVHEDVAILAGSFVVVEWGLPPAFALLPLFLGIVSGDILLYGLGGVARRNAFLRKFLINDRIRKLRAWLDRNLVMAMTVCRLVPGTVFPVFVACGWFRLSFRRFLITTLVSSFIYAAALLALATMLGEAVIIRLGETGWVFVAAGLVIASIFGVFRPVWRALPGLSGFRLPSPLYL